MTKDDTGAGTSQNDDPTKQLTRIKHESATTTPTEMTTVATHINAEVGAGSPQQTELKIHRGHQTPLATHIKKQDYKDDRQNGHRSTNDTRSNKQRNTK